MNKKTSARMARIARLLDRIIRRINRELKTQAELGHPKPEDVRAADGLRALRDSADELAFEIEQPLQTEIPLP